MPNEETTTKFKVDISELKKAMQDAKREISVANSEFKAVSSSMDNWSKSTDGISAKLKQLDSNLSSQKTILSSLEKQYEAVVAEQGEGSAAADRLKVAINNQKATINQTEREIGNYETALTEVGKAEKIAAATGKEVSEVLDDIGEEAKGASEGFTVFKGAIATFAGNAMTGLANAIKGGISNIMGLAEETREYRTEMAKLDTAFTTNKHSTEAAGKTYQDLYAILGDEGQAVEAANFLAKLTTSEQDLANWTNIAAGVYGTFGASLPIEGLAEAANETAKVGQVTGPLADALNWAGVSEDEFNESLSKCSNEQERQKLIMDTLNGLYGDAATKFKETNGSVMEANRVNAEYQDTMATMGEKIEPIMTSLKSGVTGLLQEFLKLIEDVDISVFTGAIEEGFSVLSNTVLPAVKDGLGWIIDNKDTLIAGLAGIAGGFVAFKVAGLINSVVTAFKAFKAANEGATIAQWLLNAAMNANPIMLIVTVIAAVVTALVTFIATNDNARAKFTEIWQGVKDFFVGMWEGICKFFTETIPNAFKSVIDWVKENFDLLLTFLINPFAGLFKYFYENNTKFKEFVDNAIAYIKELPSKVWTWLLNTINTVTTWAGNMVAKAKEAGSNFINKVIDYIKELPSKIWTWLVNVVTKIVTWRNDMVSKAKEAGTEFVENVVNFVKELPDKVWTWLENVVSKIGSWGSNLASKGKEAAQKLLTAIVDKVKEIPNKVVSYGKDIVTGLWNGINDKAKWLKDKIKGWVGNVTDWVKKFFKIGSPSKVMADLGKWLPEGLAVGIDKNAKSALSAMKDVTVNMLGAAKDGLGSATSSLGNSGAVGGRVTNFTQNIYSPKQLSRLDIYRQSKNLLGFMGGGA